MKKQFLWPGLKKGVYLSAAIMLLSFGGARAQSKIKDGSVTGTSSLPNASAIMELESNKRGLLLPRVALQGTAFFAPLAAHVAGMTVYNTATVSDVTPGYYYNNGTKWIRLAAKGDLTLTSTPLTSSTTPAGTNIGDMIYNTTAVTGPPAVPVGPAYWDGTNWVPVGADALVGNEVLNATTDKGLSRAGSGTTASPYTLGLTDGTAVNQTMVWDGTKWEPGSGGLTSTPLTSSTSPAGTNIGDMIYNTNPASGVPEGPVYWDGTNWKSVGGDPIVGNEVNNATTDKGLSRAGSGTTASPYTLGLTDGTAVNQTMVWDGTKWAPGSGGLTSTPLTSSTTPAGTNIGDMIYNTNPASGVPEGPVYWDGTNWKSVGGDLVVGNEVTDSTLNGGLVRSGSGTAAAPYTIGLKNGTAANQTMVWDGTKWAPGSGGLTSTPLTSSTTPAGNNVGDMIYNTTNIVGPPAVPEGPTYWDGTNWKPISGNDWSRTGNAGTTAATNFIGTTDSIDFVTKTNNTERMRVAANGNVGIGTSAPAATALLELNASNKALLITRVADTNAIATPVNGMLIYDISKKCLKSYQNSRWTDCIGTFTDPTSGGTSHINTMNCTAGSSGSLLTGKSALGVTQTLSVDVTETGTYSITATANGITFSGNGTFYTTGTKTIVLTASADTPAAAGTHSYNLSTTPTCTFMLTTLDGTTGGTGNVSSWNCFAGTTGTLTTGQPVSGVTQSITATVVTIGTYNISTTANGVTFSASGTFAGTGSQTIVLTAVGTPTADGTYSYDLGLSNGCTFTRTSTSTPIVSGLDCAMATTTGTLYTGSAASGAFVSLPYTGGNGSAYSSMMVSSTGVTGLTAILSSGTLSSGGGGALSFSITGTPAGTGVASFPLTFGTQSCTFTFNVSAPAAVATLDCAGSTAAGTLADGAAASGVTQTIPYTGGNGGAYSTLSFVSSGVGGLTASTAAGSVASGAGSVVFSISGTPAGSGTANFSITFAGQTCSFSRTVSAGAPAITGLTCGSATFSPASISAGSAYSGTVSVPYTGGNGAAYSVGTGISSTGVTGLTATLTAGTLATGAGSLSYSISGTPSAAGTASFALSFGGASCTLNATVTSLAGILPTTITLGTTQRHIIASVYDQNYLPYTAPTGAASTTTPSNPDGTAEAVTVNVQGTLTTAGVTIKIPATATGSGTLSAYSSTISIPAAMTEDGISRDVTLEWASQAYTASTKTITATLKSVGGTLNAKKLDINAGIGSTYLGVLMGTLTYPYNNAGATTSFELRDIPGIPDRMFGLADNAGNTNTHLMLYLPVQAEDGKIWLNNNLGAHYSNLMHASFNPAAQADSSLDNLAYGSLFQWGRKPDGHELTTWTDRTSAPTSVYGTTTTLSDAPTSALFIQTSTYPQDWRLTESSTLWASVTAANNPCPSGFRVPTAIEYATWGTAAAATSRNTALTTSLRLIATDWIKWPAIVPGRSIGNFEIWTSDVRGGGFNQGG